MVSVCWPIHGASVLQLALKLHGGSAPKAAHVRTDAYTFKSSYASTGVTDTVSSSRRRNLNGRVSRQMRTQGTCRAQVHTVERPLAVVLDTAVSTLQPTFACSLLDDLANCFK